jgi:hypothetical protein
VNALVIAAAVALGILLVSVFIARVVIPFKARRTVEKLLKSKIERDPRALENAKYGTVVGGVGCLKITSDKGKVSELQWNDVEEIHAYKRDLFTTDLICLAFKKSGTEEHYEIHEEMAGYHDLLGVLRSRLPEFTLDWVLDVAFPAFESKHRIIWKRSPNRAVQATVVAPGG